MTNTEAVRRIQAYEARQREMQEMRDEAFRRALGRGVGECIGDCQGNMANLDCEGLAKEKAATVEAHKKSQLASESYKKDPAARNPPSGYSNATDADLMALGIRDPKAGVDLTRIDDDSNFNVAVFRSDLTGGYTVGFKGTELLSREEWYNNFRQSDGDDPPYYRQAVTIARRANGLRPGSLDFVGPSLGGGLAAAASRSTGRPATTFNAAGLHPNTVPRMVGNAPIAEWYVKARSLIEFRLPETGLCQQPLDATYR